MRCWSIWLVVSMIAATTIGHVDGRHVAQAKDTTSDSSKVLLTTFIPHYDYLKRYNKLRGKWEYARDAQGRLIDKMDIAARNHGLAPYNGCEVSTATNHKLGTMFKIRSYVKQKGRWIVQATVWCRKSDTSAPQDKGRHQGKNRWIEVSATYRKMLCQISYAGERPPTDCKGEVLGIR